MSDVCKIETGVKNLIKNNKYLKVGKYFSFTL